MSSYGPTTPFLVLVVALTAPLLSAGAENTEGDLAARLRASDASAFPAAGEEAKQLAGMMARDARARLQAVNRRETRAWQQVRTRADWERFRDVRLRALRESLGPFPPIPADLNARVTRTVRGEGYRIENLVFESRPRLVVTANLYLPADPPRSMPGVLICHSHHAPKTQGELQDMGMTWARLGCAVLVMDQLGHGERRQHPFRDSTSYPGPFRINRQDYYFRYNAGMQLHLVGESLIGWMAWDLMRGVDLLLSRPGVDRQRIVLLGAVAGGGDPAAVTAALDPRIAAVAPFNFGGPQPETPYPLPADADTTFAYAGSGSWESTRNLRLSARDGFLPWVIVGSVAPRRLIYGHEFSWDRERDPVWTRLERIYGFYDVSDHLGAAHGRGTLSGKPPQSTHCTNIGPEHRQGIYPALQRWFGIAPPAREYQRHRSAEELTCLTPEAAREVQQRRVCELAATLGAERAAAARQRLDGLASAARRARLRQDWSRLLGQVEPSADPAATEHGKQRVGEVTVERIALEVERDIIVPLLLLTPPRKPGARLPAVVAFAQEGKQAFLEKRSAAIAQLLTRGAAVCLPDLRGIGETRPADDSRGRTSSGTAISSSELMLGQTLVGSRLRDLRSVLRYLHRRADLDSSPMALWGDSFAPPNPKERNPAVPLDAEKPPDLAEPLGGLLALLGALFEDDVVAVLVQGGLVGYDSLLQSPFCYIPHDAVVPGALTAGDLCDVAGALAPRPLRLTGLVDGQNRRPPADVLTRGLEPTRIAYRSAGKEDRLVIEAEGDEGSSAADWLLAWLKRG